MLGCVQQREITVQKTLRPVVVSAFVYWTKSMNILPLISSLRGKFEMFYIILMQHRFKNKPICLQKNNNNDCKTSY